MGLHFPRPPKFVRDKERVSCWKTKLTSKDTTEDIGILQQTVLADGVFVAPASSQETCLACLLVNVPQIWFWHPISKKEEE